MNSFRTKYFAKAFSVITGLLFLNMSFFLAEMAMLKVSDRQILENIVRLIATGGFEEERDGDTQNEIDTSLEDFLIPHLPTSEQSLLSLLTKVHQAPEDLYPHANYSQTFSPPPDLG